MGRKKVLDFRFWGMGGVPGYGGVGRAVFEV